MRQQVITKVFSKLLFLLLICCVNCTAQGQAPAAKTNKKGAKVSYNRIGKVEGHNILITKSVDLKGGECELPENAILSFKGGVIMNGTLIGNKTRIKSKGGIFNNVEIKGNWDVRQISTDMFLDIKNENALKNLFALTSPDVDNTIKIKKGDYILTAFRNNERCLKVCDNTTIIIDGTITLTPNEFTNYTMLLVEGNNVVVKGNGIIKGDKFTHTGTTGEWGMGINVHHAQDVHITGITVRECWGDCIYVGDGSRNVLIEKCNIVHGRRQGISITCADSVIIQKCVVTDVGGTNPEYAIDAEPNKGDTVNHIFIKDVRTVNCKGGFVAYGKAKDSSLGEITIDNCTIEKCEKPPLSFNTCSRLLVKGCRLIDCRGINAIVCYNIPEVKIHKNQLKMTLGLKDMVKKYIRNSKKDQPVYYKNCKKIEID